MKSTKFLIVLFSVLTLAACSSNPFNKEGDASSGDVTVEDRNATTSGVEGENAQGSDLEGAETTVIVGEDQYQGDELNDPASPLSNRVVYFEYDSSTVREQDQEVLVAHAAYLADHPNLTVRLEGHTDERGAREYNLALGERRAIAIRHILMLQGASINQFQITSFGEERPAVEGVDESAWQLNRRVELKYIGQ